jgi:hypothetical protein
MYQMSVGVRPLVFCTRGYPSHKPCYNYHCLIVCALGYKRLRRRPISVLTREGVQRMRKHIGRMLMAGATVVVLLAFGNPGIALPPSVDYTGSPYEQSVSEY